MVEKQLAFVEKRRLMLKHHEIVASKGCFLHNRMSVYEDMSLFSHVFAYWLMTRV